MRSVKALLVVVATLVLVLPTAYAFSDAGVERGMALFNDPTFAGGMRACNSCHPKGKGLERAGSKKRFFIMGRKQNSLEEAVNFCIVNANKGKAIDVDSREMEEITSYIKSLGSD